MQKGFPLKTRLFLTCAAALVAVMLLPFLYYRHVLGLELQAEAKAAALRQMDLVRWLLEGRGAAGNDEELRSRLVEIAGKLGGRLTYIADGGRVLADSTIPPDKTTAMESFATRPEVAAARDSGVGVDVRYRATSGEDMIFVAGAMPALGVGASHGVPPGVLRLAIPVPKTRGPLDLLGESFLAIACAVVLAAAFLTAKYAERQRRSIQSFIDMTGKIADGDFKPRMRVPPSREFAQLAESFNEMVESIGRQVSSITDKKQKLQGILDGMREGVMVLDSRGKIQTINAAMARIVNGAARYIGRRPLEAVMSPELQAACDQAFSGEAPSDSQFHHLQIEMDRGRGYDVNIVPLRGGPEEAGAILVFHDISEIRHLEMVRQDFVANVSHELRTPLTSIKGYAETLLSDEHQDPQAIHTFLGVILKNANHMTKIVEDLLELARLEAYQKPVRIAATNGLKILENAWSACAPLAEGKRVRLVNQLPREGVLIDADPDQLLQVFINLLDNAIKYSPPGGAVVVSARLEEGGQATFSVSDTGPGVPKADQPRIFERFYRVERHRGGTYGSSGLGLAICRHILKAHNGKIWVESPPRGESKGAAFLFTFPLSRTEEEAREAAL